MKPNLHSIELCRLATDCAPEVASMLLELEGRPASSSDDSASDANRRWVSRFSPTVTKFAPPRRWPARFLASDTKTAQVRK